MGNSLVILGLPGPAGDDLYFVAPAISITPTLSPELLANPGFNAWTLDSPDGWTIIGEVGHDPEATERDPGQAHADTKTVGGAANLYNSATSNQPSMLQTVLTVGGWFRAAGTISRFVSGAVAMRDTSQGMSKTYNAAGAYAHTGRALATNFQVRPIGTGVDLTLDDLSVKALSALAQWFTHARPYGDFAVDLTIPTTNFQGGVAFNAQDASNYALLYYDRLDGKVYLVKVAAGVTTPLGSWSASYSAGKTLLIRRYQDGTLDVIYNGVTLASGIAATGLAGLKAGPFLTDASGVTISRYAWDARTTP